MRRAVGLLGAAIDRSSYEWFVRPLIRTYALRRGVCALVDEGKISLKNRIQIFNIDRQRAITERSMEEGARRPKQPVEARPGAG